MPFKSTIRIPSEVLDAIVSLTELTTAFAARSSLEGERASALESAGAPHAAVQP
jgi:hypothetical protein